MSKVYLEHLNMAKEDIDNLQHTKSKNSICFYAHQTIKDAINATLIFENIEPPYTDDLTILINLIPDKCKLKSIQCDYSRINKWYLSGRYPKKDIINNDDATYGTALSKKIYEVVKKEIEDGKYQEIQESKIDYKERISHLTTIVSDKKMSKILKKATEKIVNEMKAEHVILYGSHARGTANEDSDIDLMVVFKNCKHRGHAAVETLNLLDEFSLPLDIFVPTIDDLKCYSNTIGYAYRVILREGVRLY